MHSRRAPIVSVASAFALAACASGSSSPKTVSTSVPSAYVVGPAAIDAGAPQTPASSAPGPAAPNAVISIVSGDYHACVIMADATVRCWGRNLEGELGDGTTAQHATPVPVLGLTGVTQLAAGSHATCALMGDKTVRCWGSGTAWGDGVSRNKQPPTPVPGVDDVVAIDAGGIIFCARHTTGAVTCWGDKGISRGALPTANATQISVNEAHACARVAGGAVRCWGDSPWNGAFSDPGVLGARDLSTGDSFACVVLASGRASCWGRNEQGQLGRPVDYDDHGKALEVAGLGEVTDVDVGQAHGCGILTDGSATCWGSNSDGELGRGSTGDPALPGAVPGLAGVIEISLGNDHVCARLKDATVVCWGSNKEGQLGDSTTTDRARPAPVVF